MAPTASPRRSRRARPRAAFGRPRAGTTRSGPRQRREDRHDNPPCRRTRHPVWPTIPASCGSDRPSSVAACSRRAYAIWVARCHPDTLDSRACARAVGGQTPPGGDQSPALPRSCAAGARPGHHGLPCARRSIGGCPVRDRHLPRLYALRGHRGRAGPPSGRRSWQARLGAALASAHRSVQLKEGRLPRNSAVMERDRRRRHGSR